MSPNFRLELHSPFLLSVRTSARPFNKKSHFALQEIFFGFCWNLKYECFAILSHRICKFSHYVFSSSFIKSFSQTTIFTVFHGNKKNKKIPDVLFWRFFQNNYKIYLNLLFSLISDSFSLISDSSYDCLKVIDK